MAAGRLGLAALFGTMILWAPACAQVLDLGDFQDAIAELCACNDPNNDDHLAFLGDRCEELLTDRLTNATPPKREAWLTFYAETCEGRCDRAFDCYQQDATCTRQSCQDARECCDYSDAVRCQDDDGLGPRCVYPGDGPS